MSPNRVPSWTNFGDERDDDDGPSADDAPAILRLDSAGPPSVRQQSQEASLYLTRSNPYTFISSEADARRLASTSRWLTVDTVGLENIREQYGDDAIPEDYEPNPEADPTLESPSDSDADSESEDEDGDDEDDEDDEDDGADADADDVAIDADEDVESDMDVDAAEGYSRGELEEMTYNELRKLAANSDRDDVNGRSGREEIVNALSDDAPEQ